MANSIFPKKLNNSKTIDFTKKKRKRHSFKIVENSKTKNFQKF